MMNRALSKALLSLSVAFSLLAGQPALAVLVEYTSDFADGNLAAPLPEAPLTFTNLPLPGFAVVAGGGNTVPVGDSITFTGAGTSFFRGTSDPSSVPGFATMIRTTLSGPSTATIAFDTAFPVTQIRLTVADLELAATELSFSTASSAGAPTSVTSLLNLASDTVTSTSSTNGIQGEIVWDFATPVVDPTIEYEYTQAFALDETHFASLSYTVAVPEPTAALFGTLLTTGLGLTLSRRKANRA